MNDAKSVLPVNFDGRFYFTNSSDNDFKARWNSIEYTFPAQKTTPIIIPNATPEEVQSIRKKFAREWAVQQFYGTDKFKMQNTVPAGGTPALYTDSDIAPFLQKCLEPLPIAQATVAPVPRDTADNYRKNSRGKNITRVLQEGDSLKEQASGPIDE